MTAGISPHLTEALRDRYELVRELGRGGMATVYLARDLKHDRLVALKVLHRELSQTLGPERFLREIKLAARLQHPNILPVYDSGEAVAAGLRLLWFTMPYIQGESLRQLLGREPQLPLDDAVRIALGVADGLGYAHSQGIIHRDIKPENILLSGDRCVVADFGIARALEATGADRLTDTGLTLGTPAYMSPEQATADTHLDGRSDLYGLGCVLYEMLAGQPPFTGRTAQAIIARRLSEPAPHLHPVRDVSDQIERVLAKALARSPADRFRDVPSFAAALRSAAAAGHVAAPRTRRQRMWIGVALTVAGLLLAVAGVDWYRRLHPPAAALDPNLLAVAPFDVLDGSLQLWHEGMVDILSRNLDEAGPIRTVPQSVSLRRWSGRADRASADALGERTGAGLVVYGNIARRGMDSVSLRAAVLNRSRDQTEAELEVTGEALRLGELADSLGAKVLQAIGRGRPIGAVRHVSLGSRSLGGLKEFLRGEQFYRRGLWDSALVHYDQAIAQDSTFALALWRMATVLLSWGPASASAYRDGEEYRQRALALNPRLSPRDSFMVTADTLDNLVQSSEHIANRFRAVAVLEEAARRYPQDPEIWYVLGEHRYHAPPPINTGPGHALQAFDRAISLDPGFGPAYEHVVQLSMQLGKPDLARRYARAYADLDSTGANDQSLRLVALILDSGGIEARPVVDAVRAASAQTLFRAGLEHLGSWADSAETSVALLRELATGDHLTTAGDLWVADSLMWQQYVAEALIFRGHLRAGAEADRRLLNDPDASPWSGFVDPFLNLSLLDVIADSTSRRTFGRALERKASWGDQFAPRYLRGLPWWLARRDTVSLLRVVRRAAEIERDDRVPAAKMRAQYIGAGATASLALIRGDSGRAVKLFQGIPDSLCMVITCFHEKLTLAQLLAERGEERQAGELLDRWMWSDDGDSPAFVLAVLERGRIAERLGDRKKALECYRFVTAIWPRADTELAPYVTEARDALSRLKSK